ncbi:MAG: vitamin K epoxide reductase family protein [Nanoarchaeota archaeon]
MNPAFAASFITLAIGGISVAGYLTWKHYHNTAKRLVCPLDHDCSKVTESEWSKIFLVRNEILGALFYISMLVAGILAAFTADSTILFLLIKIAAGSGLLFSMFLIWVQVYKIKDYCFYCLLSALITLLLFVNSFFL